MNNIIIYSIDQKFGPAVSEFTLTVPTDYNHNTQIDTFAKKKKALKTTHYTGGLTSKNFAQATNQLVRGKQYRVRIFPILETVTSEDCMNFLKKQNAILVGGQGMTLAQELHENEFPVDKYTVSFDEKKALWQDTSDGHLVPFVNRNSCGDWHFSFDYFEDDWDSDGCLLCFYELQTSDT